MHLSLGQMISCELYLITIMIIDELAEAGLQSFDVNLSKVPK